MLTKTKQRQLLNALKKYHRHYLKKTNPDLDESGTRLMVNSFLTEVLGYTPIEEVRTEYQIRGTYADYVIQLKGVQHFLVEVKGLSIALSPKHLRQAVNYGANEGIEWALLTNGKDFAFYRIFFDRPIESRLVFSLDLSNVSKFKENVELLQYLHKLSVSIKGLSTLWNKCVALDPRVVAGLLQNKPILNFIKRALKKKYKNRFTDTEVITALNRVILEPIQLEDVKQRTVRRKKDNNKTGANVKIKTEVPTKQSQQTVGNS